jgi:hypothetical protein
VLINCPWVLQDIVSEQPERFFVSEIIRKHVFLQYRQEVPYGVAGGARRTMHEAVEFHLLILPTMALGHCIGNGPFLPPYGGDWYGCLQQALRPGACVQWPS